MALSNLLGPLALDSTLTAVKNFLASLVGATGTAEATSDSSAFYVRAVPQHLDRISFANAISNGIDTTWGSVLKTGSGQTINQTAGNLVLTTGTTVNSETIIRSSVSYTNNMRLRAKVMASQRIANQTLFVELVDVLGDALSVTINSATSVTVTFPSAVFTAQNVGQSMYLGAYTGTGTFVPGRYAIASVTGSAVTYTVAGFATGSGTCSVFGWNYHHMVYDSTTATSAKIDTQRKGYALGDSSITINTTASPGHLFSMVSAGGQVTVKDASASNNWNVRGYRTENVPDDAVLYLQVRSVNGSAAPASTTTFTLGFLMVEDFAPLDVAVQDFRGTNMQDALMVNTNGSTVAVTGYQQAAAAADATANPTSTQIGADSMVFNGTTWDRQRGMGVASATTGDTGAKVATGNGATVANVGNKGVQVVVNMGAVTGTTPTCVIKMQGSLDAGTTWYDIPGATTASLAATGVYGITVYPAATPVTGTTTTGTTAVVSQPLPRAWRIVWTLGGTSPSFTLTSVQYQYMVN